LFFRGKKGVGRSQIIINMVHYLNKINIKSALLDFLGDLSLNYFLNSTPELIPYFNVSSLPITQITELIENIREKFKVIFCNGDVVLADKLDTLKEILMVTTPLRGSLEATLSKLKVLRTIYTLPVKIILNKVGQLPEYEFTEKMIEQYVNAKIIGKIPYDLDVIKAEQLKKFYVDFDKSAAAVSTKVIAEELAGISYIKPEIKEKNPIKNLVSWLKK